MSRTDLRASIEAHNHTFESLLKLIPARYYISKPPDEVEMSSKYMKNKRKRDAPKQAIKEASKKAKREKLDPANQKTVLDIQKEAAISKIIHQSLPTGSSKSKGKAPERTAAEDEDDDGSNAESSDIAMGSDNSASPAAQPVPMQSSGSITELRARLHARMAALRRGRGGHSGTGEPESRDALLEERRLKNAGLREKRRQGRREQKKEDAGSAKKKPTREPKNPNRIELIVPDSGNPRFPQHDALANVTFSKVKSDAPASSSKHSKKFTTSSDPHVALAQLTARATKLASLPADKRAEFEERDRLAKAEIRADGGKIHDDASRLKKAIKRKETEKFKSKKGWEERKEAVVKNQAAKQKKRTDNIAMRNERRSEKRKGIKPAKSASATKGKSRPGFEGRDFSGSKSRTGGKGKGK